MKAQLNRVMCSEYYLIFWNGKKLFVHFSNNGKKELWGTEKWCLEDSLNPGDPKIKASLGCHHEDTTHYEAILVLGLNHKGSPRLTSSHLETKVTTDPPSWDPDLKFWWMPNPHSHMIAFWALGNMHLWLFAGSCIHVATIYNMFLPEIVIYFWFPAKTNAS